MRYLAILLLPALILFTNCTEEKTEIKPEFKIRAQYKVDFPEPSGLSLSFDNNYLWSVSDDNSRAYLITKTGKTVSTIQTNGDDLEGICVVDTNLLATICERNREILLVDTLGNVIKSAKLDLTGDLNKGLEGITINRVNGNYYLLNEKDPGLLIVVDSELNEMQRIVLNFAKDYAAICFTDNNLWIISDEDKKLYKCTLTGKVLEEYFTGIQQVEGVTVDETNGLIYLVSDIKEMLYVCEIK